MFCKKCGSKLPENAQFCTNCGAKVADSTDKKTAYQAPKTSQPMKNKTPKKMSKKAWIIVAIAAVVLICGGFLYNDLTNPRGVWLGDSNATVLDIENDGTGFYNAYGFNEYNTAITWKRTGFNTFQISLNHLDNNMSHVTFDAKLENGKLVTPDGDDWNAETFKKTHKSDSEAKADVKSYINPSLESIINSPTQHIWVTIYNHAGGADNLTSHAKVSEIYVTQNGHSTYYALADNKELTIAQLNKMSNDEIINYAKNNLWSKYNHGKPSHDKPTKDTCNHSPGSFVEHAQKFGNYFYTGYANTMGDGDTKNTDYLLVRMPVPNKNATEPCLQ